MRDVEIVMLQSPPNIQFSKTHELIFALGEAVR